MRKRSLLQSLPFWALGCSALLFSFTSCSKGPVAPPREITINADDKMKYDLNAFEVAPGQKITVTLKNIGTSPKISMGHNFIVLKAGVNGLTFTEAGSTHASTDYIDPAKTTDVIAHTKLLGPGESDTITFTAPFVKGTYEYVCSFPGHYGGGMKGVMTVQDPAVEPQK
ncbi:MAG: plastocyanin/azurin family copper-binding protein [Verrucomicrobiota bacterium]|nr:plastocyanin/azurin family copper-binding protein [Verrucomicrobiota bacterium]